MGLSYSNTSTVTLHCYNSSPEVSVGYSYSYSAGVHTLSNGDPGYPEESELEIYDIEDEDGNDLKPLFDRMDRMFGDKEGYQSPYDYIYENLEPEPPEPDYEPDWDDY